MTPSSVKSYDHQATMAFIRATGSGSGNRKALKDALERGANPNWKGTRTIYGQDTLLHLAIDKGDLVAMEILLENGARRNPGRFGVTPALAAAHALIQAPSPDALAIYRLALKTPREVFTEGGEIKRSSPLGLLVKGCGSHELVDQALALSLNLVRGKDWPSVQAVKALEIAVKEKPLGVLQDLIEAGAPLPPPGSQVVGLVGMVYRRFEAPYSEAAPQEEKDAWWAYMAKIRPHVVDVETDAKGMEYLKRALARQLDASLPKVSKTRPGPRL